METCKLSGICGFRALWGDNRAQKCKILTTKKLENKTEVKDLVNGILQHNLQIDSYNISLPIHKNNSPSKPKYKHVQVTHASTWVYVQIDYLQYISATIRHMDCFRHLFCFSYFRYFCYSVEMFLSARILPISLHR